MRDSSSAISPSVSLLPRRMAYGSLFAVSIAVAAGWYTAIAWGALTLCRMAWTSVIG